MTDRIVILDFGSQFTQLIGRRIRDMHVYCELLPWSASEPKPSRLRPKASSSGGRSPSMPRTRPTSGLHPEKRLADLGICYGMQALAHQSGGKVTHSDDHEYGLTPMNVPEANPLLHLGDQKVWMSHGDHVAILPPGYVGIAHTSNTPYAGMANYEQKRFGLQFHPEVSSTQYGNEVLDNFILKICACQPSWTSKNIIGESVEAIRKQVGDGRVLSALSGGVDSAITTALGNGAGTALPPFLSIPG